MNKFLDPVEASAAGRAPSLATLCVAIVLSFVLLALVFGMSAMR